MTEDTISQQSVAKKTSILETMQTSNVSIELSERIETKTKSIHDNKDSFEYWKNSLIKLGYERSKTSFLEECDLGEEKNKKVVQSVRLRRAATAGIKKKSKRLKKELILIVAAHRLSAIKDFDLICFMNNGKITEQGTHVELMSAQGLYYNLYRVQAQDI